MLQSPASVTNLKEKQEWGHNMKRLEIKMYIDIDESKTYSEDIIKALQNDFDFLVECDVKRVDLIDETEI